ncbi:MAG: hypothetical protein WCC11_06565 [Gammaproteobacteria bacterium]
MLNLNHFAKLTGMGAATALLLGGIAGCSQGPGPAAKKVLMACLALPDTAAGQILGGKLIGLKLSGTGSPVHICEYINDNNDTAVLLQISGSNSKNPAADLAEDAATQKALFKNNIVPTKVHVTTGFGEGAFFVDNTLNPTSTSVQLHIIQDGYKMMVQVNNPKDFASGEKQAAALAQKAFDNIKNGSAFQPA